MGRANQFNSGGGIFHLTHRCHNRAFLLKFARDRDGYREMLRRQLEEFKVCLQKAQRMVLTRRETEVIEREKGVSVLQESPPPYGQKASPKSGAKAEK